MNKYHKKFLSSFACENVVGIFSRYRGAPKEITESWGMLEASKLLNIRIDESKIIVVGDGCSPRTGIIFAYFTKADVISIDPQFNLPHWEDHVDKQSKMGFPPQRIEIIKDYIENLQIDCSSKHTVVIWPHSHANMLNLKVKNYLSISYIALPCCVRISEKLMKIPHIMYDDYNICSERRSIHIWKNINEKNDFHS